jgi:hypothetical protein
VFGEGLLEEEGEDEEMGGWYARLCVCVCVRERERGRGGVGGRADRHLCYVCCCLRTCVALHMVTTATMKEG